MKARSLWMAVAGFEWSYQLRGPLPWMSFAFLFLMGFALTAYDQLQLFAQGGVHVNAPRAIAMSMGVLTLYAAFVQLAMVAGAVLRDDETRFAPLLRSSRLTRWTYLGGRFGGAMAVSLLVLTALPLSMAIASCMPWLDPHRLGPFQPQAYMWALLVMGLPTALILGSIFFAVAAATRSMMWSYLSALALLVGYSIAQSLMGNLQLETVSALFDPFGIGAFSLVTKYWTAAESNASLPPLSGVFLANRLLWLGVAGVLFLVTGSRFRFEQRGGKRAPDASSRPVASGTALPPFVAGSLPALRSDRETRLAQFLMMARFDMAYVMKSPAFIVMLVLTVLNTGVAVWFAADAYGTPSVPVTRVMVQVLSGLFGLMFMIIAIYHGGELVWRDRERRLHEIVDSTPAPGWVHLVPKIGAIALVLLATAGAGVLTGMAIQLLKGVTRLEPMAYVGWFLAPMCLVGLQTAVLSMFIQVLAPQKFIGWAVMVVYLAATVALRAFGLDHDLIQFSDYPMAPLSDLNGQSRFWIGQAWFQGYWTLFSLGLAVWTHAFWRRGNVGTLRQRASLAWSRLQGGAGKLALASGAAFVAVGGFIYWNTCVLNRYTPAPELEKQQAEAEKTLKPFEALPQPRIVGVTLKVDLYPREARAVTEGVYRVENRTGKPISELHLDMNARLKLERLEFPGATLRTDYPAWGHRIYDLAQPLMPGQQRELRFRTVLEERGFVNDGPLTSIVDNGTFLNSDSITPTLGVNPAGFLMDRAKRRKHGLPEERRDPPPGDVRGRDRALLRSDSDWITADLTVTTDADQTPVAPGYVVSDTTERGRRTVHFRPDAPLQHFFSIQSARYAIARDRLGGIDLAVYHHPDHAYNVKRMLEAMKVSLDLYGSIFSPYPFRQARIIEFPAYASFAQSFANTVPYSEDIGFLVRAADPDKIDYVTYVTAHEIAHQWWGHQVTPAAQQGAGFLMESLSQYSALLVMEKLYGPEHMRKFLKYELDAYLRSRRGDGRDEQPLARVENQPYIHYQKGSLAMWWLKEEIGAPAVNRALASFLKEYAFRSAPYPSSRDLLRHLRREAGPRYEALVSDLFEQITLVDLRARDPRVAKRPDGRWDVAFTVEARKFHADGQGVETEAALDEDVDVGVFAREVGSKDYSARDVLLMRRARLHTGTQSVQVTVDRKPAYVGVDPYNKRIDRNSDDNLVKLR